MKNYFYITGTSRGIGKALAERLLKESDNMVIGLSRNKTIVHKNYTHYSIDLSDAKEASEFKFENFSNAGSITLINNAGAIGEIKSIGKQSSENIEKMFTVNITSAAILINKFVGAYQNESAKKTIVNISSGAAKNPISGWSAYCASKAALEMYSRVLSEEQEKKKNRIKVLAISPGIIDTQMQEEIREASPEDFPRVNDFVNYKTSRQLLSPELVSEKIFHILLSIETIPETIISLRDY
jgi:benzil reductase ((S)-benzoin forming)